MKKNEINASQYLCSLVVLSLVPCPHLQTYLDRFGNFLPWDDYINTQIETRTNINTNNQP